MLGTAVDNEHGETVRGDVEGHLVDLERAHVAEQRVAGRRAQRGELVHAAGRSADVVVLGAARHREQLRCVRARRRTTRRARSVTEHTTAADDDNPDPLGTSVERDVDPADVDTLFAQRPHHAGRIGGPVADARRELVERNARPRRHAVRT